jgi:hypothetical protein
MLYLWKIYQSTNTGYDTYDAAVVVAETEDEARRIHPSQYLNEQGGPWWEEKFLSNSDWALALDDVNVEKVCPIPDPPEHLQAGTVLLASFNAG